MPQITLATNVTGSGDQATFNIADAPVAYRGGVLLVEGTKVGSVVLQTQTPGGNWVRVPNGDLNNANTFAEVTVTNGPTRVYVNGQGVTAYLRY